MTTPVEVKTTTTSAPAKAKKPVIKRDFNELGRFFAKVRIDAQMSMPEWVSTLKTSNTTVNSLERGNGKLSLELATAIGNLIATKTPHFLKEFSQILAKELNVLFVPAGTSAEGIERAYNALFAVEAE